MQKHSNSRPFKCHPGSRLAILCLLFLVSLLTIAISCSNIIFISSSSIFNSGTTNITESLVILPYSLQGQISKLQTELGDLLRQLHNESAESKELVKFSDQVLHVATSIDKLAGSLASLSSNVPTWGNGISKVDEDFAEAEESEDGEETMVGMQVVFNAAELQKYTSPKPNRETIKKNFLGVEAITPSIALGCAHMATDLNRYMTYKMYGLCPDDWDLAQKLITSGCDPLPRRRCLSRGPPNYSKPLPVNSSLWTQPSDANILWSHYKCKGYPCLVSDTDKNRRGFFKCADCFNLTKQGWEVPTNETISAEFTIDQVLALKPGEIRIGLDFSPTTGSFAALMRERNVTIASSTLNLGAPFNEVIALRGFLPLYVSIGTRLPFFDNTLDIVHSTLFLDGWIGVELLQFVLFDWDRVLRPKGVLWVDRFFCKKEDMKLYVDEFLRLGYRKLLWRVVPKTDKLEDELYFSAVLEKPSRR